MFKKAFTLIELSIVLIIMGIMAAGATYWLKHLTVKERVTADRNVVNSAKDAIVDFAIKNKRLPTASEFSALNIKAFANTNVFYDSDAPLQVNLCDRINTPLTITDQNNVSVNNIGFVVAVAGTNTQMQTSRLVNNITFPTSGTLINTLEYDDSYGYIPLGELQSEVGCKPIEIANPSLYVGTEGTPYTAEIVATGGTGLYNFSITSTATGLSINNSTGVIEWANPIAGSFQLSITVGSGDFPDVTKKFVLVINSSNPGQTNNAGTGTGPGTTPPPTGGGPGNGNGNGGATGGTPGAGGGTNNGNGWNGNGNNNGGWR